MDHGLSTAYAKKTYKWDVFAAKVLKYDKGKDKASSETPPEPLCSLGLDYNINIDPTPVTQDNGFIRVLDTASGFMMIARSAFDQLSKAHPEWLVVNDIEHSGGPKIDKYYGNRSDHNYCASQRCPGPLRISWTSFKLIALSINQSIDLTSSPGQTDLLDGFHSFPLAQDPLSSARLVSPLLKGLIRLAQLQSF